MTTGCDALTEREKQALRLLVRGHDAKSIARQLDLSVHTINERLREARRKLAVPSSREAARRLFEHEGGTPEPHVPQPIGAAAVPADAQTADRDGRTFRAARLATGAVLMSFVVALLAVAALPHAGSPQATPAVAAAPADPAIESAARQWLALLDQGRWDDSYAATGTAFRALNTVAAWTAASLKARAPLGAMRTRVLLGQDDVPAPPHGYQVVRFRTDFANKAGAVETVTLDREGDGWRVVGVTVG